MTFRILRRAAIVLFVGLPVLPALAADEKAPPANPFMQAVRRPDAAKVKVYTNDDLKKLYGGEAVADEPNPASESGTTPETGSGDPLKELFDRQAKEAEHKQKIADAEAKVAAARDKIADLEKRKLALRNPLLRRPVGPEEKTDEWKALGASDRVKKTDEEIAAARADVEKLQAELDTLRRSAP